MIMIMILIIKLHKNYLTQVFRKQMIHKLNNIIFIILQSKQFMAYERDN